MPRTDTYHDSTHAEVVAGVATTKVYIEPLAETGSRSDANAVLRDLPFPLEVLGGEDDYEAVTTGATRTVDLTLGNYAYYTLAADLTVTFPSVLSGKHCAFRLRTIQNGTGGWNVTWPTVTWFNTPNPDTSAGAREDYYFESTNGGSTWFGWWLSSGLETPVVRHTTDYTLTDADLFACHVMDSSSAVTLVVPSPLGRIGAWVDALQWGTGPLTVVESGGSVVQSMSGLTFPARYAKGHLLEVGANEWSLEVQGTGTGGGGGGGGAAPAVVHQNQSFNASNVTSHSITFDAPATAGNLIVCGVVGGAAAGQHPSGITSGFVADKEAYGSVGSGNYGVHIYSKVAAGGETTFAYTTTSGEPTSIGYWEVSGASAVDKAPAVVDNSGTTTNVALTVTTTGTLAVADEWAVAVYAAIQGTPSLSSINQGFVMRGQSGNFRGQFADLLTSSTGALNPTLSWSPGSRSIGIIVTYQ